MAALVVLVLLGAALTVGSSVGLAALVGLTAVTGALALVLAAIWGLATWGADRWIARARTEATADE
jgi:hypothetical protein